MKVTEFEKWLDDVSSITLGPRQIDRTNWPGSSTSQNTPDDFIEYIQSSFTSISKSGDAKYILQHDGVLPFQIEALDRQNPFIPGLMVTQYGKAALKNFETKNLEFVNSTGFLKITNVITETLSIYNCPAASFEIRDCSIGTLVLQRRCARNFDVSGGIILDIDAPSPDEENPFRGSVYFDESVQLPKESGRLLKGPQTYRNLRAHIAKLENAPMVSLFHRLEMIIDRERESRFERFLSRCYSALSSYGSSSLTPVLWLVLLMLVSFSVIFNLGGAILDVDHLIELKGWRLALHGEDAAAQAHRAIALVVQSTANPVGIFGARGPLVASNGWLAVWLFLHGLLSTLFIALFIFAVRRRFKMT